MSLSSEANLGGTQANVPHANEANALCRAYFFGPFRIMRGNQTVGELVWRRNKAKSLLKWFLLNPGRKFSAQQLIALFWPDIERSAGLRNLHVTINYLRHLLEPDLLPHQDSTFICRNKHNFYWFELNETWWADIFDIQYLLVVAKEAEQSGDFAAAIMAQSKIAEYCRLVFLPADAYEDTFAPYRRQYERIYAQVLGSLIKLCAQADMLDEVFAYAHQALLVDPYCEPAMQAIVGTYFQQGNVVRALRQLEDFRHLLMDDLGLEPGEDIQALRKKISR